MPGNQVKGQGQMAGADGSFGTLYTLDNGFNFEILSARYTVEPFNGYEMDGVRTDDKMLVLDIALKNANETDMYFDTEGLFTLVDEKNQNYSRYALALESLGSTSANMSLKPGQGLGQPGLKDPLRVAFVVPGKARLTKIIVNHGRKGRTESVIRYYIAGTTKAEAGADGDPKNVIAPLPDGVRDPADASGAVALAQGKGVMNTPLPSGAFALTLTSFAVTSDPILSGAAPDDGKQYAVASVTAKSLLAGYSTFDVEGGNSPLYELTDADGERYAPVGFRKAVADEEPEHDFKRGDDYKFRVVFAVPKAAVLKKLVLGTRDARVWAFNVTGVK